MWGVGFGVFLQIGLSAGVAAQSVTAEFTVPHTPLDFRTLHLLRACQSAFEREIRIGTAADTLPPDPRAFYAPLPPSAVSAGQRCLQRLGNAQALTALDFPLLLRLAVGVNADSLVQRTVARQLEIAGPVVRNRGHVLETAIDVLLHNRWDRSIDQQVVHRTPAHDTLAQHYAAQLDTMQPVAQVLASRLRVMTAIDTAMASRVWNVDADLAQAVAHYQLAWSVPLRAVPPADTAYVRGARTSLVVAWLTYLKTPTHAHLTRWIAVRDSMLHVPPGQTIDSLMGHSAPRLDGDYWFNLPSGTTAPVVPAPGVMSLLLFGNDVDSARAAQLQQLHAQYPTLQIILVAMTHATFGKAGEIRDNPAQDAERIQHHLTDDLHLPGIVCVLQTHYHTEPNARYIPLASPVLDRYHLDPRAYAGHAFLVDAKGWLVEDRARVVLDGKLIQRLFAH